MGTAVNGMHRSAAIRLTRIDRHEGAILSRETGHDGRQVFRG